MINDVGKKLKIIALLKIVHKIGILRTFENLINLFRALELNPGRRILLRNYGKYQFVGNSLIPLSMNRVDIIILN